MANTFDGKAWADAVTSVSNKWDDKATTFLGHLEALAQEDFSIVLPEITSINPALIFTGRDAEMVGEVRATPQKPANITFGSILDPGDAPSPTISTPGTVAVPTFVETSPDVSIPGAPTLQLGTLPAAPSVDSVSVPDAPVTSIPAQPTLSVVSFPEAPEPQLPIFDRSFPSEPDLLLQTTEFQYNELSVATPLMDAATTKLLTDITDGGYGIETSDEDALWDRARDRASQQGLSREREALTTFTARGYSVPPGAAVAAVALARNEADSQIAEANREISVARAELFRRTREFSLATGIQLDTILMQQNGFAMERALNASRITAEHAINVLNAKIARYNIQIEAHNGFVNEFRVRTEAARTEIEIFKAEIDAEATKLAADQTAVALYSAIVNAENQRVALYEAQIRAAALLSDIERNKVNIYRAQVDAFTAEVGAQTEVMRAFETQVRGELAKVEVFRQQVAAYESRVRSAEVESRIEDRRIDRDVAKARIELEAHRADIDTARVRIAAEDARVRALLAQYAADTDVYRAAMSAWEAVTRVDIVEDEAYVRAVIEQVRLNQTNADLALSEATREAAAQFQASNAGGEIVRAMLSSIYSSVNAITSESTDNT